MLLRSRRLQETAVILLLFKRHLVSENGFTESYIHIQPVCSFCLAKKTDRMCMPCCKRWPVEEKQAYVDSTHLNNSDKLSRIIYGSDKMHIIIYILT